MKTYNYRGISTNNLKDISVGFNDHEIIYIGGVSGSGKSSLAFDTIAAISEFEFGCLINDNISSQSKYCIVDYDAVLAAATLKQLNFNVNPRSTILTYFGIYPHLSNILSLCTGIEASNFSPNSHGRCKKCNGLGYIDGLDESLIVDPEKTLKDGPFRCWNNSYSDFFSQLLHCFCTDNNIDKNIKFYDLNKDLQTTLLYSCGSKKYKINFVVGGRKRTKTSNYIGPIRGLEADRRDMFSINKEKYTKPHMCPYCKGSHLTDTIRQKTILPGIDVNFILTSNFNDVAEAIDNIKQHYLNSSISKSCDFVVQYIEACRKMHISHLNFSRTICTLSGGELQRLRITQLILGKIKNILLVLDEPTGSLDSQEVDSMIEIIKSLSKNYTIIVVDHNEKLQKIASRLYFLGPQGGVKGGNLISEAAFIKSQEVKLLDTNTPVKGKLEISLSSEYVNYGSNFIVYQNALNGICGSSGIGKTTILRDILPYRLENYKYISQKPIKAGRNSKVASYAGLFEEVRNFFSVNTRIAPKFFSLNQEGACHKCQGKGSILLGDYYNDPIYIECEECNGTGFAPKTLSYRVAGMSIYDFLCLSVDEAISSRMYISKKFDNTISVLSELGLGHLKLNQPTNSLSGGENQRLKLSQALKGDKTRFYGLDEPSKGLGKKEMYRLIEALVFNIRKFEKTFIVSEHNEEFLHYCYYVQRLTNKNGKICAETIIL
jgi:excinuclease UvrABC ATPase subunit